MVADLAPSERVLWTGSPVRHPVFDSSDRLVVPGAIFGVPFTVFWISTATNAGAPSFFVAFGYVFLAWTVFLLIGRPALRWLELRATVYTVTDQRVVIEAKVFGVARSRSRYLRQLSPPRVAARAGGLGDVRFDEPGFVDMVRANRNRPMPQRPFELRAIDGAERVRDLIMAASR
ncbi:hypothetical protein [Kutzneria buriramensis]|uniref:PH (Pleckstrin Homology) domain-containing protein n=1 Tax=Kutzneria buriramensis TaxID=1045776 RepID=A0A3E0GYT5_9PSEU|nr:hypothetical protein [Kutzneria buriramensis]REH32966.1 hypothetical protein BCF44_12037 [Kutzneria buriramensis]